MTVDHKDGNASNNDLNNLGLNCPSCDCFRHCGFHSMNGELFVRYSKISQSEIVRRYHEYFLTNGKLAPPEIIDQDSQPMKNLTIRTKDMKILHKVAVPDLDGEISALIIANILLQINPSDLEPTFGDIKGFFT